MRKKRVLGIDPGKTGAIALVEDKKVVWVEKCPVIKPKKGKPMYDERSMAMLIAKAGAIDRIVLEKVHAMPGQGVVSMFTFGEGFGIWKGICAVTPVSYILVAPQTWKKKMLADIEGDCQKTKSILAVHRMFPEISLKKSQHGHADAIMLAAWGFHDIT